MTDLTRTLDALEFAHSFFEARAQMATPGSEGAGKLYECAKGCADALALLKAQEPRVMTLEEVLALKYDDVVYCEVCPTKVVLSAIVIDVIPKMPNIDIGVVQLRYAPTWNGINNADLSYYGKTWRCWTSRPTDEQREATPWDE